MHTALPSPSLSRHQVKEEKEDEQRVIHNTLSSYECHKLSRLYRHLRKVTSNGGANLTEDQFDTARITLIRVEQRVSNIGGLCIRHDNEVDLYQIHLEPFVSLEKLALYRCPPSTIVDLYSFRHKLWKLEIVNSGIPELGKVLGPIKPKYLKFAPLMLINNQNHPSSRHIWAKLTTLSLCNCGLVSLDSSLHLVPHLTSLDVSHNDIQYITHLYHATSLSTLNISRNRIRVLSNLGLVIQNIRRLDLSYNMIESLDGLEKLYLLEQIDISHNKINDFSEFSSLSRLEKLHHIYAIGNPLAYRPNYRLHLFTQFLHESSLKGRALPVLDGVFSTNEELFTLKSTIFLPPEIITPSHMPSATPQSNIVTILIGGTLMRSDDVPIHELDRILDKEIKSPTGGSSLQSGPKVKSKVSTSLTHEQFSSFCSAHGLRRKRESHIVKISELDDEQPLEPVDITLLFRASSTGSIRDTLRSSRHSNETLIFPGGGIDLLEFEDGDELEIIDHIQPRNPPSHSNSECDQNPTRTESLASSGDANNILGSKTGSFLSSSSSKNRDIGEWQSKSSNSSDPDLLKTRDLSFSTILAAPEVPDLSELMQQMASVSQNMGDSASYEASSDSITPSNLQILIDTIQENSSNNSPSLAEKFENSPDPYERSYAIDGDSPKDIAKRNRKSRWGNGKPPLADGKSYGVSKSHHPYSSQASQRSNSPPGSIISDSWEYKQTNKPNIQNVDAYTEVSSVYSGDDMTGFSANLPTTSQLTSLLQRANQEEALLYANATKQFRTPIQSYTGSIEFEYLSVSDNLEKYFSEQVFGSGRPSGDAPYMRYEVNQSQSNRYGKKYSQIHDYNYLEILFIDIPYQPERLVNVFRVKLLDTSELEERNTVSSDVNGNNFNDFLALPQPFILVLTDINLYVLLDNFSSHQKFGDAPLPVVKKIHSMDSLRSCTIYFGFQRCAFQFCDDDVDPSYRSKYQRSPTATTTYVIVTKDKALTYPLITTLPTIANNLRQSKSIIQPKVYRENKDSQLLDRVADLVRGLRGEETDIVYYQMLYQIWKLKPGVMITRTLILTPKFILFCEEDVTSIDVKLSLIDSVHLSNISRVRQEEDPLKLTIIMKSEALSFKKRKWRLVADTKNIILKVRDEIRKACLEAGINIEL